MYDEIYNECFMIESNKQDRNSDSFRAIRLDDLFKIIDKYNNYDKEYTILQIENTKLKQDKQELIGWLKEEMKWCKAILKNDCFDLEKKDFIYYQPDIEARLKMYKEVLEKLGE